LPDSRGDRRSRRVARFAPTSSIRLLRSPLQVNTQPLGRYYIYWTTLAKAHDESTPRVVEGCFQVEIPRLLEARPGVKARRLCPPAGRFQQAQKQADCRRLAGSIGTQSVGRACSATTATLKARYLPPKKLLFLAWSRIATLPDWLDKIELLFPRY